MSLLAEQRSEKYAKKLIGSTDLEDALKRLDKLTHEEAWMGIAQNLKATHTVGESVREVADKVVIVDNRVAGVDDRVRVVDDRVAEVVADSRIRSPPSLLPTLSDVRTPRGSVMFWRETWPDRNPYATGTLRSPTTRSTTSSKV